MKTRLLTFTAFTIIARCSVAQSVDSIIHQLNGCWKWDHYFGGFASLPPTPANQNIHVEFFQDAQDSANHMVSAATYKDNVLKFRGRCNVIDTLVGNYLLSCPLFDSVGIVGSPPVYFNFENDTLLFPQQELVDGFVYGFLQNCDDTTTQVENPETDFASIYPNPASEQLFIDLKNIESLSRIQFYDVFGQGVADFTLNHQTKCKIDVSIFPEGVYFIRIETQQGLFTKKILFKR